MTLPTDELVKKATTTTTQVAKLIPQLWASVIETNQRYQAVMATSLVQNTDLLVPNAGDTVYIPSLPDIALADVLTEGTDMTPIALSTATSVAMIPAEYGKIVEITRKALDRIKYDGMAAIMDRLAYSMSLRIEGNCFALANATVPGTSTKLTQVYPNGKTSTTVTGTDIMTSAAILAARLVLQQGNNVPFEDGYYRLFISPKQAQDLMKDADVRNDLRYGAPDRLFTGELGTLHQCRIIVTNYVAPVGTAENTVFPYQCMLISPRFAAIAWKRMPQAYIDPTLYDGGRKRRFGITADFDVELIHAERAVVLKVV